MGVIPLTQRGHGRKLPNDGAVAQLGERLNGIQEVVGSIPISSTEGKSLKNRFFAKTQIV
jgi:hypothetical protein